MVPGAQSDGSTAANENKKTGIASFAKRLIRAGTLSSVVVRAVRAGRFKKSQLDADSLILLDYPVRPRPRYGHGLPRHELLAQIFEQDRASYEELLRSFLNFADEFASIPFEASNGSDSLAWRNDWLSELDAVSLYALVCQTKPKTYFEIGSGYSTKFVRRAIERHDLQTKIVSLDPHPRAEIDALSDENLRFPLEDVDLRVFERVQPGDMVFFDGSHCCFTNSDVTVFFLEVLPKLPAGTLVHIHDIFLPFDYPPDWNYRFYSEQYVLAAMILGGAKFFDIVLPNQFAVADEPLGAIMAPLWERLGLTERVGRSSSFWIRTK
ncbi:MAG: class I SAM-dependent methyltransferase [Vulcanimicrobiaceae bacterium]